MTITTTNKKRPSIGVYIASGATAGVLEMSLFHPVDTVGKRLMNQSTTRLMSTSQIVFPTLTTGTSLFSRHGIGSLYPGFSYGFVYKVMQRTYKFGLQPVIRTRLPDTWDPIWRNGIAGSIIGCGEVALLPLDALKVKAQTGSLVSSDVALKNISRLYRGAAWVAARNIPGSFALFAGKSVSDRYLMHKRGATAKHAVGAVIGSISSILVASPLDVVKTRIQASNTSGLQVCRELYSCRGLSGFFYGIIPKTLAVGPKLMFSFFVASVVTEYLVEQMEVKK